MPATGLAFFQEPNAFPVPNPESGAFGPWTSSCVQHPSRSQKRLPPHSAKWAIKLASGFTAYGLGAIISLFMFLGRGVYGNYRKSGGAGCQRAEATAWWRGQ